MDCPIWPVQSQMFVIWQVKLQRWDLKQPINPQMRAANHQLDSSILSLLVTIMVKLAYLWSKHCLSYNLEEQPFLRQWAKKFKEFNETSWTRDSPVFIQYFFSRVLPQQSWVPLVERPPCLIYFHQQLYVRLTQIFWISFSPPMIGTRWSVQHVLHGIKVQIKQTTIWWLDMKYFPA